jgi:rhodanese-related sulfurtransferase
MRFMTFPFFIGLLVLATITSCGQGNGGAQIGSLVNLDPAEFSKAIQGKEVVLIDVRTLEEYEEGYIEGATNLNYFDSDFEEAISSFEKEKPVYVYCASGGRSEAACEDLVKTGVKMVYNLSGGMEAWRTQKLPVTQP